MQLNTEQIKQLRRQEIIDLWLHQVTGTKSEQGAPFDEPGAFNPDKQNPCTK